VVAVEIRQFGSDDLDDVRHYVEITNACRAADAPWLHPITVAGAASMFRTGWDGEPPTGFLAVDDGHVVGLAELNLPERDNRHLAWVWLGIHPDHRRRGIGTAVVEHLAHRSRAADRRSLVVEGWESDAARGFAAARGLQLGSQWICRRQVMAEVDWDQVAKLHEDATLHASDYRLERRTGHTPAGELEALAELTASINDAPTDDLDFEDEVFDAERIRVYEDAQLAPGHTMLRVLARHRETGALAGHSVVVVDAERPWIGEQHDTAVARAHRGHRLGLLLKTEMLSWLREAQPQLEYVDTGNAETNRHMIAVNDQLGYRVMQRGLEFQRSL
jgi:GNAT superfamily N-acetyltransferase